VIRHVTHIYRWRIVAALSACCVVFAALVALGLAGASRLTSNVRTIYTGNIDAIGQLADMRTSERDARSEYWRAIALHDAQSAAQSTARMRSDLIAFEAGWLRYYPNGISSKEEAAVAEQLKGDVGLFRLYEAQGEKLLKAQRYDDAVRFIDVSTSFADGFDALISRDIAINVRQAERFSRDSSTIFDTAVVVGSTFIGSVLLVAFGVSWYLLRAHSDARRETHYHMWMANRVLEHTSNSVMVTDRNGVIERVNPAFTRLTDYRPDEVQGQHLRVLNSGRQDEAFYEDLWQRLNASGHWKGEVWNRRKNGELYLESMSMSGVRDERGRYSHFVAICSDVTQRQLHEDRLSYLATHDALTGLLNRTQFVECVQQAISMARRKATRVAVMFIDLDGFKAINDTFGHAVGDEVLKVVGTRLKAALRDSDAVARFGGDEFAVMLEDMRDCAAASRVARTLVDSIGAAIPVEAESVQVTASIGISLFPEHGTTPKDLLLSADLAMYEAKSAGKNGHCIHGEAARA
jgi:diguanylate cyclase (GGDEF)-like protein/PAS domain S-box-containing protein